MMRVIGQAELRGMELRRRAAAQEPVGAEPSWDEEVQWMERHPALGWLVLVGVAVAGLASVYAAVAIRGY